MVDFDPDPERIQHFTKVHAYAALIADGPITVTGVECISKSWPGFVETYRQLGGIAK